MGRMPMNSNIGLGPELLSQSSIGQEKPVSEIDKKMELVENSVSGSTMDQRDRLSRVPDNGNSSGAEEGFGKNRDRVAVEQVREEDISDLDSNAVGLHRGRAAAHNAEAF